MFRALWRGKPYDVTPHQASHGKESNPIPASIPEEYDASLEHWSRQPDVFKNGSNLFWGIVFVENTHPDEIIWQLPTD